jgi:hypothetical protein
MKHAFIIGGTGMLAGVTIWLNETGYLTTVLARNQERFSQLEKQLPNHHQFISLDYKNTGDLKNKLRDTINNNGKIDLVIAWIHLDAPEAIPTILSVIAQNQKENFQFFHIKGSSYHLKIGNNPFHLPENCVYHDVQLGFKLEGNRARWLTHEEICAGVISAIQTGKDHTIVGQVEPWEMRP